MSGEKTKRSQLTQVYLIVKVGFFLDYLLDRQASEQSASVCRAMPQQSDCG